MAGALLTDPHQNQIPTPIFMADPNSNPNSPLSFFNNEMAGLRVDFQILDDFRVYDEAFNSSDAQPLMEAVSQIVVKTHNLFSTFLRNFYYPLKWSLKHCEKERTELLDHVQFWYQEFQQHVHLLSGFSLEPQVKQTLNAVKTSLLYNSIVANGQPRRVIKHESVFETSVRSLHSNQNQNISGNGNGNGQGESSRFRIFMLKEEETQNLFQAWRMVELNPNPNENLISPSVLLKLDEKKNILRQRKKPQKKKQEPDMDSLDAAFANLKVNRSEKGQPDVLWRKCCLLYLKTVVINGVVMETWCLSLPFVLICGLLQVCSAHATIFWDNYFKTEENWQPYQVKEETTWAELSAALVHYFKAYTKTEWTLTPQNLQYIGQRIFGNAPFHGNSKIERKKICYVSFARKGKEKTLTTWRWLFSIAQLIKKQLRPYWNSGAIIGFIDRAEAEHLIRSKDRGTFLLRFSDGTAGAVSYTVAMNPTPKNPTGIFSVAPLTDTADGGLQSLRLLSLDQRIMPSNEFTNVLYFEPSLNLNLQQVLKPKGEIFTRPAADPAGEQEANGTATAKGSIKNPYGKPVVIVVDDPSSIQIQTPETSETGGDFVQPSTSQNESARVCNEWQNPNLNQNQNQNQNQDQMEMEMNCRPADYLFSDLLMIDVTMEMEMELAELSQYSID